MTMRLTNKQETSDVVGFSVATEPADWGTLLVAEGEMDIAAVPELRRLLDETIGEGAGRMVIDLTAVDFVDSVALATLVGAKRRLGPDGQLAVVITHPYVMLVFEATGLNHVVTLTDTREAAIAAVAAPA